MSFFGYMKGIYVLLNDEIRPNVGLVRIDRVYMLIGNWSTYIDEALKQTTNVVQWQSSSQIIISYIQCHPFKFVFMAIYLHTQMRELS